MKNNYSKEVFKFVLNWLQNEKGVNSKIAVQKTLFYLQEKGFDLGYSFEPYSYGPFSRQIMEDADYLQEHGEILIKSKEYQINNPLSDFQVDEEKNIQKTLDEFDHILNSEFTFNNLELYGTVLYCIQALIETGGEPTKDSVKEEFRSWKHQKYSDSKIEEAYNALTQIFLQ